MVPLDKGIILNSVKKTGRLVICEDAPRPCSFASEVSATVSEDGFSYLRAPIKRVTREPVPVPFSTLMEEFVLPNEGKIVNAIKGVLR